MTPLSHTFYSGALFLALLSVLLWVNRRRRVSQIPRRAITDMTNPDRAV